MTKKNVSLLFFFIFCAATTFKVSMAMGLFQSDFESRWDYLSNDVQKLNEYTATRPVELRNVKVEDKNLGGATFNGATFSGVEWQNTYLKKTKFTKTVFKDSRFIGSLHQGSVFTDVVFENCVFQGAEFSRSTFVNVRFKNCKITDSRFENAEGNELVFENSHLETRTSLAGSSLPMTFRHSTLNGVALSGMKMPNKMTIEDSILDEVDFGRGNFSEVVFKRIKHGDGPVRFNQAIANSFLFEDVELFSGLSMSSVKAGNVIINNSRLKVSFPNSSIPRVTGRDTEFYVFGISEGKMPHVEIANSRIHYLALWDGFAEEMIIKNSEIGRIEGENFIADIVLWDNVTLDGEINLTNAQVNDFRLSRLTRGPNLNLITTGSNMRFD